MPMPRRYSYSPAFKLIYLWLPHVITIVAALMYMWIFLQFLPRVPVVAAVALSVSLALVQLYRTRKRLSSYPVLIEVEGDRISLYGFKKYFEFTLDDVRRVRKPLWLGGWVVVDLASSVRVRQFSLSPHIRGLDELVGLLRRDDDGSESCGQ